MQKNGYSPAPHSAEYFGEQRKYWWNADYLSLLSKRFALNRCNKALDLGCGIGHWTRIIRELIAPKGFIVALDREKEWIQKAAACLTEQESTAIQFQQGSAEAIPFPDHSFDLVTCQTLLMHVPSPLKVLKEMMRVLKPEGSLLLIEPNNLSFSIVRDNIRSKLSIEDQLKLVKLQLFCEAGKKALGKGDNSIGDLIPGYLAELDCAHIDVFLSDKAFFAFPKNISDMQKADLTQKIDWAKRDFWIWSYEEALEYFRGAGGAEGDFITLWEVARQVNKELIETKAQDYSTGGGHITYIFHALKNLHP